MKLLYLLCLMLIAFTFQETHAQKAYFIAPDIYPGQVSQTKMLTEDIWFVVFNSTQPALTFNAGKSWTLTSRIDRRYISSIYADYRDEIIQSLWAGTDSGLYKSTDLGNTWYNAGYAGQVVTHLAEMYDTLYAVTAANTTGYPYTAKYFARINLLNGNNSAYEIPAGYAVNRFTQTGGMSYLFVQTQTEGRLLVSVNRGQSWRVTNNISTSVLPFIDGFAYDKYVFKILGTTTNTQTVVFQSVDTGKTFSVYTPLQGDTNYQFVNFNPSIGKGIMLGTNRICTKISFNLLTGTFDLEPNLVSFDFSYAEVLNNRALAIDSRQATAFWKLDFLSGGVQHINLNYDRFNTDLMNVKLSASGKPFFLQKRGRFMNYQKGLFNQYYVYPLYDLKSLSSPDDSTIFVSGAAKSFYRSTDGGFNFTYKQLTLNNEINDIHFFNGFDGLLVDNQATIYKTNNGGDSWTVAYQSSSAYGGAFTFVNNDTGYVCASPGLLRTTNGGQTWQQVVAVAQPTYDAFLCVGFDRTGQYGFASSGYQMFKSTNGGQTWTELTGAPAYFYKLFVTDANNVDGIALSFGTAAYTSTNGGQVWKRKEILPFNPGSVAGTDINNFYCITGPKNVFKTDNNFNIAGLSIPKGFAGDIVTVDLNADINRYKSANSLQFIISLDTTQARFTGFSSATHYSAANWSKAANFVSPFKLSVAAYGTDSLAGIGPVLGLQFLVSPGNSKTIPLKIESFQFNNGSEATYTMNGKIIRDSLMLGDVDINSRVQAYDAAVIVRFLAGVISVPGRKSLVQADVTNDGTVSALDASIIARYVVGSITSLPNPGPTGSKGEIKFAGISPGTQSTITIPVSLVNAQDVYSLQSKLVFNPNILKVTNISWNQGAGQFIKESKLGTGELSLVCASSLPISAARTDIATVTFTIINAQADANTTVELRDVRINELTETKTGNKITVNLLSGTEKNDGLPKDFSLSGNYPNPFNPSTKINFEIPYSSHISLKVFDVLGAEVATLINEAMEAGRYSYTFDALKEGRQLQAGVYFYRLQTEKFSATKKMILVK